MSERHRGGCFCGALRYKTIGKPVRTAVCHCRYCQLRTGTAFGISVYFKTDQVSFNNAPFETYSYDTESGNNGVLTRCANCGTNVSWKMSLEALKDTIGIAGGTFDPPTFWYKIEREVFVRSKANFCQISSPEAFETSPISHQSKDNNGPLKGSA